MATTQTNELLTDEFLMDLYYTCFKNEYILSIVCEHIRPEHLPDREFQALHKALQSLFRTSRKCPSFSMVKQSLSRSKGAMNLLDDIYDTSGMLSTDECVRQLEAYIRQVHFQKVYKEVGELYNKQRLDEAYEGLRQYTCLLYTSDAADD